MSARVLLVRHPPVAKAWVGRCYGQSDMGWSRDGALLARHLSRQLAAESFAMIVHSGAIRTRRLAEMIGRLTGRPVRVDPRWLERDFGAWEGRSWQAIWRDTGDLMDRMVTDPAEFRPGGGETGMELSRRAQAAWNALPTSGNVLVVTHGGPVAALCTSWGGHPPERMIDFVPEPGAIVVAARREADGGPGAIHQSEPFPPMIDVGQSCPGSLAREVNRSN